MNKKTLLITIIVFSCLTAILVIFKPPSFENINMEMKIPEKEEEVEPKYISPDEQEKLIINSFIQELMGDHYQFLIFLFEPTSIPDDIDALDEEEFAEYAQKIGNQIKEGKNLQSGEISNILSKDGITQYTIILHFDDGSKKMIELEVQDGMIITSIEDLF